MAIVVLCEPFSTYSYNK